jgi:hypothetical protein
VAELNITNIPAPRVPVIDERTGLMAREWYRFFQNLFVLTGSGSNPTTLDELQIGPPSQQDFTEIIRQVNTNIAPQYEDQSGDFLATLDTAQLMSMMARFENAEAAIQGAYLQPVVQTGTIANYNLDGSPTAGGIVYGTGPALAVSAAGTLGQVLTSAGAGTPTWSTASTGTVSSVSVVSANGLAGTVATATTTPAITLSTTVTGLLKGNGTAISAATSGTDYAPATSGTSILYGNGAGGFSNVTIGTGVAFTAGTLSATGSGGTVTSVAQSFTGGLISVAGSPITTSGTLALTVAGTSGGVPYFSSGTTWATSAALAASALVVGGGAGAAPATITTGTGVTTALGVAVGSAGAFVVNGGALGTPSSGTVTNLTGTASININGTVGATTPATGAFTTLSATSTTTHQGVFSGWDSVGGANFQNGSITIGSASADQGVIHYRGNGGSTALYIDNTYDVAAAAVTIRTRTNGTPVEVGTFTSTGLAITGTLSATGTLSGGTSGTGYSFSGSAAAGSLTLDASGNLGVGTTSIATGRAAIWGNGNGVASPATNANSTLHLATTDGTVSADNAARITFNASPSNPTSAAAKIEACRDGQDTFKIFNCYAAPIAFGVNNAEVMRIGGTGIVTMSAYGAGAATFSAAGVISSVSDETWKVKDGAPVDSDAMLNKLEPGYWYYNDEKKETFGKDRQLGFYAQNVNAAIGPEAAPEPEENKPWGYYDRSVLAVTVMSLQKALKTIELLTERITALESK